MVKNYDVAIVGAGPAGLSAALILGRSRRRVIVFDHNQPRNYAARAVHGYLGLDGIQPQRFRCQGASQCKAYGVTFVEGEVTGGRYEVVDNRSTFWLEAQPNIAIQARKVLLATGVVDHLPDLPGFHDFYGTTIHHCPYCDGWEHRDKRLVAYGKSASAAKLAIRLLSWSKQVTCCTDGVNLPSSEFERLRNYGIPYQPGKIARLKGTENTLEEIQLADGDPVQVDALFFSAGQGQRTSLPSLFGCECDTKGLVVIKGKQGSGVRGLFLAGDADGDVQFAIVAAAEGAIAATAINSELDEDDYP
jgi:thioredoxin reductase